MGNSLKKTKRRKVLVLGLDNAGKTAILHCLKTGEFIHPKPTVGLNVQTIEYKKISFICMDICGRDKIRPLWKYYFESTNIVAFVVDSNDKDRLEEAKEELHKLMKEEELKGCPLLVFANKQDLIAALSLNSLVERLKLREIKGRKWWIQACCALTGDGLFEALDWAVQTTKKDKYKESSDITTSNLKLEKFGLILENWFRAIEVKKAWIRDLNSVVFRYYALNFEC